MVKIYKKWTKGITAMVIMKKLLMCILFVLCGTQVIAQDFDKGYEAYQAGDYATALVWWYPLAEQGDAAAQSNIGLMFELGNGVLKDYSKALKWYRLSAEQGSAFAQFNIGVLYNNGNGVLKDYSEALKWYRLSAEQGDEDAQSNMGFMYEQGHGVLKDNITAHMWFNIASANGNKTAGDNRDRIEIRLTSEDISKATAMARECMASDYKKCGY